MQPLILYPRRQISTCSHHSSTRNVTKAEGPWTFVRFIFHPLAHKYLTNKSIIVTTSCSLGPINIMSSMNLTSVLTHGRERLSRALWTKLWHRDGELIYPWTRRVMMYCWFCQLKANCLLGTLLTGMDKKPFVSSVAVYQEPEEVLIFSSIETTSGTAAVIGGTTC